jgi:hypothetical protein
MVLLEPQKAKEGSMVSKLSKLEVKYVLRINSKVKMKQKLGTQMQQQISGIIRNNGTISKKVRK